MKFILLLFLFTSFICNANTEGVFLGRTRVIFNSSSESESLSVTNSSSTNPWLLRSWISGGDSNTQKEKTFIITPPLYKLEPSNTINLKINKLSAKFPSNQESLFYVNVMAIPPMTNSQKSEAGEAKINFSINNKIKLLYRPESLNNKSDIENAYNSLKLKKQSGGIVFENQSPYYITLTDIKYNGKTNDETGFMLSPFSESLIKCSGACNNVNYKIINDFGGVTPEKNLKL